MTYPERYLKYMELSDDKIPIIMHQISPKTKETLIEVMKQKEFPGSGDFKTLGLIFNIIFYSNSTKVLEIGTRIGFSGLVILDGLRKSLGKGKKLLVTIDPNQKIHNLAENFFKKAGFDGFFKLITDYSESSKAVEQVEKEAPYDVIFIDSLHEYAQIKKELKLYFGMLKKGGFLFCHDSSEFAQSFDKNKEGGIRRGLKEFIETHPIESVFFEHESNWGITGLFMGIKK